MSRRALFVALVSVLAGVGPVALAAPVPEVNVGPGYLATNNVEWIKNIPINTDSSGARIVGHYLYVTDDRGLSIYDTIDPLNPALLSVTPVPQLPQFPEEDVDTNGRLLLISGYSDETDDIGPLNTLFVLDVTDKAKPVVVSTVAGADNHTISCILDCTYAYGNWGTIVDLRDPAHAAIVGDWQQATGFPALRASSHDVTEVAPGLIVTSTNPVVFLDARTDPIHPTVLAIGETGDNRFIHANLWPRGGTDKFLLAGGETVGNCDDVRSGGLQVFDTTNVMPTPSQPVGQFHLVDTFRIPTGDVVDGRSPYNSFCAHWFNVHPTYHDGGLVAMGWYEHGTRFLNVDHDTGKVSEVGWFVPAGGVTSAAYWMTDSIVYNVDYQRGIDILRFTNQPATATVHRSLPALPVRVRAGVASRPMATSDRWVCPRPGA